VWHSWNSWFPRLCWCTLTKSLLKVLGLRVATISEKDSVATISENRSTSFGQNASEAKKVSYFLFLSLLGGSIQLSLTSFLKSTLFSSFSQESRFSLWWARHFKYKTHRSWFTKLRNQLPSHHQNHTIQQLCQRKEGKTFIWTTGV
jgi:hypothetical protein